MTSKSIVKQPLANNYLFQFSPYADMQAKNLIDIGGDISKRLSRVLKNKGQVGQGFIKTYGYLSLWILGSYEFTRTLDQNGDHFQEEVRQKINEYKKKIAKIRMPIAKYEHAGKKDRILFPALISNVDFLKRDFIIKIESQEFLFKDLFKEFKALIKVISKVQ